jgi:RNA polymerase sigma factor (sigma-70 family)
MTKLDELHGKGDLGDEFLAEATALAKRRISRSCANDADDLAQDVAIKVWQNIASFDQTKKTITSWVKMLTDSIVKTHLVKVYAEPQMEIVNLDELPAAQDKLISRYEEISEAFGEEEHQLLDLLMEGYTFKECQDILGISRKAFRWRIEKIRRAINPDFRELVL